MSRRKLKGMAAELVQLFELPATSFSGGILMQNINYGV